MAKHVDLSVLSECTVGNVTSDMSLIQRSTSRLDLFNENIYVFNVHLSKSDRHNRRPPCANDLESNSSVIILVCTILLFCGPGSSVGIATDYRLDRSGIESRWEARFSAPVQTGPRAHPASCTMGTGSFPVVKSGRGVTLTPHLILVPWS